MGSDTRRMRALARRPRRPKFRLGDMVIDVHGQVGAVASIYADLTAVEESGGLSDAAAWLAAQKPRPKTKAAGIWYTVVCDEGEVCVGEDDLKKVRPTS
jgi:hypothetical protein